MCTRERGDRVYWGQAPLRSRRHPHLGQSRTPAFVPVIGTFVKVTFTLLKVTFRKLKVTSTTPKVISTDQV